jgi:hypothetical protein
VNLPHIGAPHIDNCCATLLIAGNRSHTLNLDRIAFHQGFDPAEFTARFLQLETAWTMQPHNSFEVEGK